MQVFDIHILIEQGLQSLGIFAYADMEREEVDLQFNQEQFKFIDDIFEGKVSRQGKPGFQDTIKRLDDIKEVQVKDKALTPVSFSQGYQGTLPDEDDSDGEYMHLINNRSIVSYTCSSSDIKAGDKNIIEDYIYTVQKGNALYNSIMYAKDTTFTGVNGEIDFTTVTGSTVKLTTVVAKVDNRLLDQEDLHRHLVHPFSKTKRERPISNISDTNIYVYTDGADDSFTVTSILIDYIKVPSPIKFDATLTATGSIVEDVKYEVVSIPVTYDGTPYLRGEYFTGSVAGGTSYTGAGTIKLAKLGDCLLSERASRKIVDRTVNRIAAITEQSQEKILNLTREISE